jgi:hypothetical protein
VWYLPGEKELLFPPLSHLEVVGVPHVERYDGKPVVVVSVRPNINQKAKLIEEMLSHRKQTIIGITEHIMKEIVFDVKLVSDDICPQFKLEEELEKIKQKDAEWFNIDSNFQECLSNLLTCKETTISDFLGEYFRRVDTTSSSGLVENIYRYGFLGFIPTQNEAPNSDQNIILSSKEQADR